jgi:hypothetical protein
MYLRLNIPCQQLLIAHHERFPSRPSTRCTTIFHGLRCFPLRVHRCTGDCRVHPCPTFHVAQHGAPAVICRRTYARNAALQSDTPSCCHPLVPRDRIFPMDSSALLPRRSPLILAFICLTLPQVIPNGGFFITNMFSFLEPTPLTLTTPFHLKAYGWTTTDVWSAPMIAGLYALLTHAQPFWAELHSVIGTVLGGVSDKVEPLDPESARALCALILAGIFSTRTVKNFGLGWKKSKCCQFLSFGSCTDNLCRCY